MPEIHILPKEVYQLIAAGEVVERPSSVVKEMTENALDAGARHITVEIKNGGTTYIRITDDGCGIEASQVKKVFVSHATSKIQYGKDLDAIATLGFRGEAMASIAAVARVELLTKAANETVGTRYVIAGGEELECDEAGCPQGTTIVVRDIFFNTPARMKFLKKDVTEGNAVAGIIDRMAISHPEVSFRFIRDGKQTLITPGNGDLKETVYAVFGREFAEGLLPVDYRVNNMHVSGFVTKPTAARKSRAMQYFFINSRLVKSQTAMAALEQAYRHALMVGKFPGCVLNIECDPALVDVNVHPAKIEVRFANEKPIFELVYYGVKSAIETEDSPKEVVFREQPPQPQQTTVSGRLDFFKKESAPEQITMPAAPTAPKEGFWQVASTAEYRTAPAPKEEDAPVVAAPPQPKEDTPPQEPEAEIPAFRVIGEAFKTYLLVEMENALYLIDKHAAHERMNYEQMKQSTVIHSQVLLSPVTVKLSREEYTAVCDNLEVYAKCGFTVEDFGNATVIVRECPSILDGEDIADLMTETAGKLLEGKTDITPEKMDWIFHSASCRAAIKAGDATSPYERERFVKKLLSMPDIRYCPHGRPVMIKMTKYEIEKQFGRV